MSSSQNATKRTGSGVILTICWRPSAVQACVIVIPVCIRLSKKTTGCYHSKIFKYMIILYYSKIHISEHCTIQTHRLTLNLRKEG
jgi:hypothetical protein